MLNAIASLAALLFQLWLYGIAAVVVIVVIAGCIGAILLGLERRKQRQELNLPTDRPTWSRFIGAPAIRQCPNCTGPIDDKAHGRYCSACQYAIDDLAYVSKLQRKAGGVDREERS